jgi:hypothetical protein
MRFTVLVPTSKLIFRFDRGWLSNFLEFWRVPGWSVDYRRVFDVPSADVSKGNGTTGTASCTPVPSGSPSTVSPAPNASEN